MNNKFKINLESLLQKDIDDINGFIKQNPNNELLIRLNNTCGVRSSDLLKIVDSKKITFRIAGGYDEDRKNRTNNFEYYENKGYYTRNELINIIRTFEQIEKEITYDYSPIEMAYFIYNKLKRYITYSHHYHLENHKEINSLLGILYRKTSSYGFSLIFKEMMDRRGIKCHFVEGNNMRYAWNIIEVGNRFYCLDLSYDSYLHHIGNKSDCYYFGVYNKDIFNKYHKPLKTEIITDYNNSISMIDNIDLVNIDKFFKSSKYRLKAMKYVRNNNTSYMISGIEIIKEDSNQLYKYLYCDYSDSGRMNNAKIIVSEINIFANIRKKEELSNQIKYLEGIENKDNSYRKQVDTLKNNYNLLKQYDDFVINKFLIPERIEVLGDNNYIGAFDYDGHEFKLISNPINKSKYNIEVRKYRRDDGSVFIIEKDKVINNLYYYKYYEFFQTDNNYLEIECNNFITDNDLMKIEKNYDKYVANVFFYRKRLLKCVNELGGYMGYCDYGNGKVINKVVNSINNNVVVEE